MMALVFYFYDEIKKNEMNAAFVYWATRIVTRYLIQYKVTDWNRDLKSSC